MTGTSTKIGRRQRPPRYDALLAERITTGVIVVHATCHNVLDEAEAAQRHLDRLQRRLQRFGSYTEDYTSRVLPEERAAWHVPLLPGTLLGGAPPTLDRSCRYCRRQGFELPLREPSPARVGRWSA